MGSPWTPPWRRRGARRGASPGPSRSRAGPDPRRVGHLAKHVKFMVRAKKVQGAPAVRRTLGARVVVMRLKRGAGHILIQSNLSKSRFLKKYTFFLL